MLKYYDYRDARMHIENGDIVFIRDKVGPIANLIRFFTKSNYSHAGISFWIEVAGKQRLMMVEAQGGAKRRIVNISYYNNAHLDVFTAPKEWNDVGHYALDKLSKVQYGYFEAIYVGIREFLLKYFDVKLPSADLPGEICSEFIANIYQLPKKHISPQLLFEQLIELGYEVKIEVRK